MDDTDPPHSGEQPAPPTSPRRQDSTKAPRLGDFSRIESSFTSPASSPRPPPGSGNVPASLLRSALSSPSSRHRRSSLSVSSTDKPASLGDFSKLLAILQTTTQSRPKPEAANEAVDSDSLGNGRFQATVVTRESSEAVTKARASPGRVSFNLTNVSAVAVDVTNSTPSSRQPVLADSSSTSELGTTSGSESDSSSRDDTTATSLASSPDQHPAPKLSLSVSRSWNALNKKRKALDLLSQQQSSSSLSSSISAVSKNITSCPFTPLTDERTKAEKHESLSLKLARHSMVDSLTQKECPTADDAVHVFLDHSNINISFRRALQIKYANSDYSARFVPSPHFNLEFLTEVLLRGRETRILNVGCSTRPDHPQPAFVVELRRLGYHVDVRERKAVSADPRSPHFKASSPSKHLRKQKTTAASAHQDDTRYVEDLVDETLQTRIGESVMEFFDSPGTLVLATGDGKPAKYSDGFFAYADRALRMGWNVELVSWGLGLSSSWTDPEWTKKWGSRFRLIELDEFLDDLWVSAT